MKTKGRGKTLDWEQRPHLVLTPNLLGNWAIAIMPTKPEPATDNQLSALALQSCCWPEIAP